MVSVILLEFSDFFFYLCIEFLDPGDVRQVGCVHILCSHVDWGDNDIRIFCADCFNKCVEFFDHGVSHGQAANRDVAAVDENVAAWLFAILLLCFFPIKGVGVVEFHGQMKVAIRVEPRDFIQTLGDLKIAFSEFGSQFTTTGQNGIVVNAFPFLLIILGPQLQNHFVFDRNECDFFGREDYLSVLKMFFDSFDGRGLQEFCEFLGLNDLGRVGAANEYEE